MCYGETKFPRKIKRRFEGVKVISKKEAEEEINYRRYRGENGQHFCSRLLSAKYKVQTNKQRASEEKGWIQYNPWTKERDKKSQTIINVATIHGIAKRMMAREWARALGRKSIFKFDHLKMEAFSWKKRKSQRRKE
jgi:hypothetical protein